MLGDISNDKTFEIVLTQGAIDNGYMTIVPGQDFFPKKFFTSENGQPEESFYLELPSGEVRKTHILSNYNRIQLRLGLLFKQLALQPGDKVIIKNTAEQNTFKLTFYSKNAGISGPLPNNSHHPSLSEIPLNQILFGPPGTGKTFTTVAKALEILDGSYLSEMRNDRSALKKRFDEHLLAGDIRFVTFHQSFSYEDFVEGIRAQAGADGQLSFEVTDGIFKSVCDSASARTTVHSEPEAAFNLDGRHIWKMSLGNSRGDDSYIFDECIDKGYSLLGWGGLTDFSGCTTKDEVYEKFLAEGKTVAKDAYQVTAVATFLLKVKKGDILIVSEGNSKFRAIGEVTGDYRALSRDEESDNYGQCRSVKWLRVYEPSLPNSQLMNNNFSQMTLYQLRSGSINIEKLLGLLTSPLSPTTLSQSAAFKIGEKFGSGYEVAHVSDDLIELIKPNKRRLPIGMSILKTLVQHVRDGSIALSDIKEKKVFEKLPESPLEPFIVNGYEHILHFLVQRLLSSNSDDTLSQAAAAKAKVLIIDEINRGNISRIFGELITLIEPTKRRGASEALEVTLPYSKQQFSVPSNLYIIGTMNTADRSLSALDIALRRRFAFVEMSPDSGLLEDIEIQGINVGELLSILNARIETLMDRDHRLGHAYFLPLKDDPTLDRLGAVFRNQIMPLLQEYFFEDWTRIQMVLNDHRKLVQHRFITEGEDMAVGLFGESTEVSVKSQRWIIREEAFSKIEPYLGIIDATQLFPQTNLSREARYQDFTIKQLSDGSIEVWQSDTPLSVVKPKLVEIANDLKIDTMYASGTLANTRHLGRRVIDALTNAQQ